MKSAHHFRDERSLLSKQFDEKDDCKSDVLRVYPYLYLYGFDPLDATRGAAGLG
jgi:hypothetical protein